VKEAHLLAAVLVTGLLLGCENIGHPQITYSDLERLPKPQPSSERELAQCPKPNGLFQNEGSLNAGEAGLQHYFRVDGFRRDSQHLSGADLENGPGSTSETAIHLLGGIENGIRRQYKESRGEQYTIEIRPLSRPSWFHLVVRSSLGRTGEGEGRLDLSRNVDNSTGNGCQDGALRGIYSKTGKVNVAWWVEPSTGDIVGAYQTALERGEISFRYKRVGP